MSILFAAMYPNRTSALIMYGAFPKFNYWVPTTEALEHLLTKIEQGWGAAATLPMFAPSFVEDPQFRQWYARFERLGASPGAVKALMRMNSEMTRRARSLRGSTTRYTRTYPPRCS